MNKAIKTLRQVYTQMCGDLFSTDIEEAFAEIEAELQTAQAKLGNLREYCLEQIESIDNQKWLENPSAKKKIYQDMLTKLYEEPK